MIHALILIIIIFTSFSTKDKSLEDMEYENFKIFFYYGIIGISFVGLSEQITHAWYIYI
jgi:hypothetical protein